MLKSWVVGVVSAVVIAASGPALAQEVTPPAEQAQPAAAAAPAQESQVSPAQLDRAVVILQSIVIAFEHPRISDEDKLALLGCIYANTLGTLNDAVGEFMAAALKNYEAGETPTKFDPSNHDHVRNAVAVLCQVPSLQTQP